MEQVRPRVPTESMTEISLTQSFVVAKVSVITFMWLIWPRVTLLP
jgi:hypothetical protein